MLTIADSGAGIEPGDLAKIFDPFFSTKAQGTGLGLALVQQIVVDHGGTIEVDTAPGAGTTFTLTFPTRDAVAARSVAGGGAVGGGAGALTEPVVQGGELQVQRDRVAGLEDQGAFEGGGGLGALARRGEGPA